MRFWRYILPVIPVVALGIVLLLFAFSLDIANISNASNPQLSPKIALLKDIFLVIGSSVITFSGTYVGALMQSSLAQEKEKREIRRRVAEEYRVYIASLLKQAQHAEYVESIEGLKEKLPENGQRFIITSETLSSLIDKMPLTWQISGLEDRKAKEAVDAAIDNAIGFVTAIYASEKPDYESIQATYTTALKALEQYENRF